MRFNNQKGISLVEIIAAIAIIGIVAISFSTSIGIMMRNEQYAKQLQHNTQIGQTIMENLANEVSLPTGEEEIYAGVTNLRKVEPLLYEGTYQGNDVSLKFSNSQSLDDQPKASIKVPDTGDFKITYSSNTKNLDITGQISIAIEPNPTEKIIIQINHESALPIQFETDNQEFKILWNKVNSDAKLATIGPVQVYDIATSPKLGTLYQVEVSINTRNPEAFTTTSQIILQTKGVN